jgi:formylglycine-generating enzyme required for sulfatase activity
MQMHWYDAAAYCNWLSKEEGLPEDQWSYEPNSAKLFGDGMKIRLGRQGYRLPSEGEWEYAGRAGAVTDYCFGHQEPRKEELLKRYGWYEANSSALPWPVGTLRPNDLGLFDVHGNVLQWCQDHQDASQGPGKGVDGEIVHDKTRRVSRGGCSTFPAVNARFSSRHWSPPEAVAAGHGFRLARTCD